MAASWGMKRPKSFPVRPWRSRCKSWWWRKSVTKTSKERGDKTTTARPRVLCHASGEREIANNGMQTYTIAN
eukprot:1527935-Pyramimonas_sp.AAC.1